MKLSGPAFTELSADKGAGRVTTYNVVSCEYHADAKTTTIMPEKFFPVAVCSVKEINAQAGR